MNILAAYYTHNIIRKSLLNLSLQKFKEATKADNILPIISSWEPIDIGIKNIISPVKNLGLLNILIQLAGIIEACEKVEWDYIAFCEHDCLYPPDYFNNLVKVLEEKKKPVALASLNHIGLRPNGYAETKFTVYPMSSMVLKRTEVKDYIYQKVLDCGKQGWCLMEPQKRDQWFLQQRDFSINPVIHVNMDNLQDCHHLTDHYNCYSLEGNINKIPWTGDYKQLKIYTDHEIKHWVSESVKYKDIEITGALYGSDKIKPMHDFMSVIRKVGLGGRGVVSNLELGRDPAPGIQKQLEIEYRKDNKIYSYIFKEDEIIELDKLC